MSESWVVCQIGAREHYAIARSLHRRGVLGRLITDAWIRPESSSRLFEAGIERALSPGVSLRKRLGGES